MRKKQNVKKNSWKLFSRYIRLKDADDNGFVKCVTCGTVKHYKEMHAGHYLHNKCDYDERNVHPQCIKCNHFLHGNGIEYHKYMLKTYSQDEIDILVLKANKPFKKDLYWFIDVEKEVKEKLDKLYDERPHLRHI
jgi:hypothetical protein